MNARRRVLLFLPATFSACVSVQQAGPADLPVDWQRALPAPGSAFRDPSGVWRGDGRRVGGGKASDEEGATLALAFFPGRRMRATRYRLAFDPATVSLAVTPLDGPFAMRTVRFTGTVDATDGSLLLPDVPVRGSAFGASVDRHSTRVRIGLDGALYTEIQASSVGVSLFVPVAGTARIWGRWERAAD